MTAPAAYRLPQVYLVGAGPGDPGLITLRAVECLRRADVVFYDYLVNPQILEHCSPQAELVCLGRHGQGRILSQDEVNQRVIDAALAGKTVVRLKGGDPALFARLAEETEALTAAGISFQIVPGITTAQAAASYAGIPLTDRDWASAVALVTGRQKETSDAAKFSLDYVQLADFPGTLVFYMGVTSASDWSAALIAGGKPAETPVALVRRCSWPDQDTIRCTLGTLPQTLADRKLRPPVIAIVGEVARHAGDCTWFSSRPLSGKRVLVTRPAHQADDLRSPLQELGAEVLLQPAIHISDPPDWQPVDQAISKLRGFNWVVFSSANGVQRFLDRVNAIGFDLRQLANVRIAAIGPGTAAELARYHLRADCVPERFEAESLAAELAAIAAGSRFLLIRASRGREVLAEQLRAAGGEVEQVVVYQSSDVQQPEPEIEQLLGGGKIDWITVTSSAIARSLSQMFGNELRKSRLASISPVTSATLRQLGFEPTTEAGEYTMAGLVGAILNSEQAEGNR